MKRHLLYYKMLRKLPGPGYLKLISEHIMLYSQRICPIQRRERACFAVRSTDMNLQTIPIRACGSQTAVSYLRFQSSITNKRPKMLLEPIALNFAEGRIPNATSAAQPYLVPAVISTPGHCSQPLLSDPHLDTLGNPSHTSWPQMEGET